MIPVLTPEESARLDREASTPVGTLMERAGLGVALAAVEMGVGYGDRVVVLAGPGNNGGDGYVAARHLAGRGVGVEVAALGDPRTEAAGAARDRAVGQGIRVRPIGPPRACDLVIDAVFGGGGRGRLPDVLRPWIEHPAPVLSVDIPTGLDPADGTVADAAFSPLVTVTFHSLKTGHLLGEGPDRCGEVWVVDIGLSGGEAFLRLVEEEDAARPSRARSVHKWTAGSVLVIGGAPGMVGAAVMAARASLHFGAGAVGLAVPEASRAVVATAAPEVLSYPIEEAVSLSSRFDVLLIGPGLGEADPRTFSLLDSHPGPVLLDADGINGVDGSRLSGRRGPTVITPHAGEFTRLTGAHAGPEAARRLAGETGAVVLLKGNPTFVTDGGVPWVVTSNGPELATIGTGDVLAGMVAALVARGLPSLQATVSAAYWHGVAAWHLSQETTVTADRLASFVGAFAWSGQ